MKVADRVPEFAEAFDFESFNRMQREALPAILETDDNVVAAAPTASGKTALAELAICRTLDRGGTALFLAPLRALTTEKESEWERFEQLGYSVYVVTGERDLDPRRAERADILVMTPEKTDSATRKHDSARYEFVTNVDCVVIDEVHLLDSEKRGSVLEVTVSRLRRLCDPRVIALSATMKNVGDVADWLDAPPDATFQFGSDYRPVDLETGVKTYTHGENSFADKYRRLYRALDLAEPHVREDGQALVFVASRQDAVMAAKKARDELAERDVPMGARGDYDLHTAAADLDNQTLRQSIPDGVAFHHAGLSRSDRNAVEEWFREGTVGLLFSTSTLAWGVNLPARCVVIRDTKYHDPLEGDVDVSPLDVLQMLGRAGRPGYDDVGYGWVVCDRAEAGKYRSLLREGKEIESHLTSADELASHLNAEVALGTIAGLEDVMEWLETTFYYVRAQSEPEAYDFATLRERVRSTVNSLVERGFVETDETLGLEPTALGRLASNYYLRLDTAERFRRLVGRDRVDEPSILRAVAAATEFDSVSARSAEQDAIDRVLTGSQELISAEDGVASAAVAPQPGELDDGARKVLAILRGSVADSVPSELRSDAWVIRQNALRLLAALGEFGESFAGPRVANLVRRVSARVEQGVAADAVGLVAVEGIGSGRAETLATGGITTPAAVVTAGVDELTRAGLTAGVAERVVEQARDCPRASVEWGSFPERIGLGSKELCEVTVRNEGGAARAGVRVTANGNEMHQKTLYFDGETTVPVVVFGTPKADSVEYTVEVVYPDEPLLPQRESRTVEIR
ncbi:MAG: DEAD/DEAH box helicase [Halobaculum sp.]